MKVKTVTIIGLTPSHGGSRPRLQKADGFEQYVQRLASGPVQVHDMPLFLHTTEGATIGYFYAYFNGTLQGTPDDWTFEGTKRFHDIYKFDNRADGGWLRNGICFMVRNGVLGKDFEVNSELAPVTQSIGDKEIQWKGTGRENPDRPYEN